MEQEELLKLIKHLRPAEKYELVQAMLDTGVLDFLRFAELERARQLRRIKEKNVNILGLTIPLCQTFMGKMRNKDQAKFLKAKGAYHLIKSEFYKGTPFEKDLKVVVAEYQKGGYEEDENGHLINKK